MFTKAIVRRPGPDFSKGITTSTLGPPDYEKALAQHAAYCAALERCGLELIVLDPDPNFPDCTFVEDTAVVTGDVAIIARPGDPRRRGEEVEIAGLLAQHRPIEQITGPGTLDGGDVIEADGRFFIGSSARTNERGAKQLQDILEKYGYGSSLVPVGSMLHLKSGANYAGGAFAVTGEFAAEKEFEGYERVIVPKDEGYAANCVFINGHLLIASGFPEAKRLLAGLGHEMIELDVSEFMKMDGGLSCLSLRF